MKRHIFTVSILLVAAQLFGQESRFWVGGSGKWTDANHWATVSGGEPGAAVPESGTSVVFDENSFSGDKNTVNVDGDVVVAGLKSAGADFVFSGKKGLTVKGSIDVDSKVDFGKLRGELVLSGSGNVNLPAELIADIVIEGGSWVLASNLVTEGNITLKSGSFNTNGYKVECSEFVATEKAEKLIIENSTIICDKWDTKSAEKFIVKAKSTELLFRKNFAENFSVAKKQNYSTNNISVRNLSEGKGNPDNIVIAPQIEPTCPWNSDKDETDPDLLANGVLNVTIKNITGKFAIKVTNLDLLMAGEEDLAIQVRNNCQKDVAYAFDNLMSGHYFVTYDNGVTQNDKYFGPQTFSILMDYTEANCFKDPISVTAVPSGGSGIYESPVWSSMEAGSATVSGLALAEVEYGTYWQVTLHDNEGCYYSDNFVYDDPEDEEVIYKAQPKEVKITGFDTEPACGAGETGKITVKATGNQAPYSISEISGGYTPSTSLLQENVKAGSYTIKVKDGRGCESEAKTTTVGTVPEPDASAGSSVEFCLCNATERTLTGANITIGQLKEWRVASGSQYVEIKAGTETNLNPTVVLKAAGTATLEMVVTNGTCGEISPSRTVEVVDQPAPSISGGGDKCKEYEITNITNTSGGDLVAVLDEGDESGVQINGLKITAIKQGTYKVKVKETLTVGGEECVGYSNVITLSLYLDPDVQVTVVPNDGKICGLADVPVSVQDKKNATGTTWNWTVSEGNNTALNGSTASSVTYEPLSNDLNNDVILSVTATNACGTTAPKTGNFHYYESPAPVIKPVTKHFCGPNGTLEATVKDGSTITWVMPAGVEIVSSVPANGQTVSGTKATVDFKLTGAYTTSPFTITLKEKNPGNCETPTSINVYFDAEPVLKFMKDGKVITSGEVCAGEKFHVKGVYENCLNLNWNADQDNSLLESDPQDYDARYYNSVASTSASGETIYIYPVLPSTSSCNSDDYETKLPLTIKAKPKMLVPDDTVVCGLEINLNNIKSIEQSSISATPVTNVTRVGQNRFEVVDKDKIGKINISESYLGCSTDPKTVTVKFVPEPEVTGETSVSVCKGVSTCNVMVDTAYCQVLGWETEAGVSTGFDNKMNCNAVYTFTSDDINNNGVKLVFKYKGKGPCDKDEVKTFEVNVIINDLPTYQIQVDKTDAICKGDERVYTIEPGMKSYKWFINGDEQSSTSNELKHTWSNDGPYTVSVKYVDNNNCAPSTDPTFAVTVEKLPEITITEDPVSFCSGNPANKTINVSAPTAAEVDWTGDGIQYLDDVHSLTPKFNSPDAGTYSLTVKVVDGNNCKNEADVTVKNVKSPTVDASKLDSIKVCYGTTEVELDGDITGDMTLVQKNTWRGGTNKFNGTEGMLSGATYRTSPSDWTAGSVWLYLDVDTDCGTITDSVKLVFLPEMVAAVGSESPFYISDKTLIEVSVTATHKHFGQVGFYLVSPTGKQVKLYNYLEDGIGCASSDAKKIGNIKDLKFTTAVTTPLNLCDLLSSGSMIDGKYTGSFGVTEEDGWSKLYGEDPAKGGWSVLIKDGFAGSTGTLLEASISFTDKNQQGKMQTILFDSKAISKPIADHASTTYYVPMGLRTSCYNTCDARAVANAVGGSGIYNEFFWANDPAITDVFETKALVDLCAGTYYVRVVDDNKCQAETSIEVLSPEEIKISEVGTHDDMVKCFNDSTVSITVTSENWIGKPNYKWYDSATNVLLDSVPTYNKFYAGKFRVVVTDVNECMADTMFTIKQPDKIEVEEIEITPTCQNDGKAVFTVKGGTTTPGLNDYTITYRNGESGASVAAGLVTENLPSSDSLIFTITDKNGCSIDTTISTLPNTLTLDATAEKIKCFGGTTSATVTVSGGTAASYLWNDEKNQETQTATGLKAGTYIVIVTDEIGCASSDTVIIEEASQIIAKVEFIDESICAGATNASIKASATGGEPAANSYTYEWHEYETKNVVSSDSIFSNAVLGGTYYVNVNDGNCTVSDTIVLPNPVQLTLTRGTVKASDCDVNNGTVEIESVSGGLAPYKYKWNALFDEDVPAENDKKSIAGLGVGFYVVEVSDSLGCHIYDTIEIEGGGKLDFETATAGVTCINLNNGQAKVFNVTSDGVAVSGAQIFWNGDNTTPFSQEDTIKTLAYGVNKFLVTTDDACRAGYVDIDDSEALQVAITKTPIVRDDICEGGFVAIISGGSGDYVYTLEDEDGVQVPSVYDSNEKKITVEGLCKGNYKLHVDILGGSDCPVDKDVEIESRTLSYDTISASNGITHVLCMGDSTGIIVGNAVGGYYDDEYVYEWRSDVWGEDSVRTTASINGLPAGSYNLKVFQYHTVGTETDTLKFEKTFVVNEPTTKFEVLADSIHVAGSHCYDSIGTILVGVNSDAFHGTPKTFTFSYDGWTADSVKTTPTLANLPAGEYQMKVVDNLGCEYKTSIEVEDLSKFTVSYETKEPDCYGYSDGRITLTAESENGSLKYSWTKDGVALVDSSALQVGLTAGKYVVKITDAKNCEKVEEIELGQPDTLQANVVFDQPIVCYGDTQASFHSEPLGGNGGFTFTWTDAIADTVMSNDSLIMNVGEGSYAIKVMDKNSCWATDTIHIVYPDSLYVVMDTSRSECAGATGWASVKIVGGLSPYVVSWTAKYSTDTIIRTDTLANGVMVDTLKNIGPDVYYVTITDALGTGCSVMDSVEVLDNGELKFIPTKTDDIYCINIANGGAKIPEVMNGKTFEFYSNAKVIWNFGTDTVNIGDTINTLHFGVNTVEVISMPDGCRKFGKLEFTDDYALRIVNVENIPVRGVETAANGALIAEIAGGYPDYTCIWQNEAGDTLQVDTTNAKTSLYGLNVGKYILYVKDQNPETCELIDTIEIRFEPLRYDTIVLKNVTCNGWNDGKIEVKGKGGLHRPYFYEWSSPMWPDSVVVNTPDIADLKAGQYMLKMWQLYSSDSVECLYDTIVVTEPSNKLAISKLLVDSIPSHCYDSIGAIVINQPAGYEKLFGGNAPFTYKFSRDDWSVEINSGKEDKVSVNGLAIGDYNLYVVDSLGCDYSTTVTINDLSEFRIKNVVVEKPICYDEFGSVTVTPTSKNGGFKYSWTKDSVALADTTAELLGIKAGTYVVKVTDDSSCVKFETIEVTQPNPIIFSVSNTIENSCYNIADGEVSFGNLGGGREVFSQFIFINPEDSTDVKLRVDANVDTTVFTLPLNENKYNLISGKYNVRVKDAVGCLSDPVSLVVNSKYEQIDIKSYINSADVTGPDCQAYTASGKISNNGQVKINFKQVSGTVSFRFDDRPVTNEELPTFKTVTSGNHTLTVGYTDSLVCAVTDTIKVKGKNSFAIEEAGFYQNGKNSPAIFTCPDNELSAYVSASGQFSYSFYAQYIEEPVEEVVVPIDTTVSDSNAVAYVSRFRTLRFRADSLTSDSTAAEPVVEVKKPAYIRLDTVKVNGQTVVYAVFADSSATSKGWADFMPYGGETYYYVSVSDGKCMDIDSIKATSMKPVNKLSARLGGDDSFRLVGNKYEVAEGALVQFEANTPQFEFGNSQSVFSENNWLWEQISGIDGSGFMPETDSVSNPMTAKVYGDVGVRVTDKVMFTAYDAIYNIDDELTCYYTDELKVNAISGIKPMEVFTPNGDEWNQEWEIAGLSSYTNVTIYVFNRWGGRVWQYSGSGLDYESHKWDGRNAKNKPLPSGTYYYVIQCSDDVLVGRKVTGPVTIIR